MKNLLFVLLAFLPVCTLADKKPPPMHKSGDITHTNEQTMHAGDQTVHIGDQTIGTIGIGDQTVNLGDTLVQGSTTMATSGDLSSEVTTGDTVVSVGGDRYERQAPSAFAGYSNTTATCFRTYGLGGSNSTGGFSLGWPFKDGECLLGEDAAQAFAFGNTDIAWKMYCEQPSVLRVYGHKRGFLRIFGRTAKQPAIDACLADSGTVEVDPGEAIAAVWTEMTLMREQFTAQVTALHGQDSAAMSDISSMRDEINTLLLKVDELEKLAHPEGTGMSAETVRRIIEQEQETQCPGESKAIGAICE